MKNGKQYAKSESEHITDIKVFTTSKMKTRKLKKEGKLLSNPLFL